jgi:hypothetical protein
LALPLLVDALRRAVPAHAVLERLGGGQAMPSSLSREVSLKAFGLRDDERRLLTSIDGRTTVEQLALTSGLTADEAFRALYIAKVLGLLTLTPGVDDDSLASAEIDLRRLESKFEEVQDADYFTVLGLPRSASSDDIRKAFGRLTAEFNPLRFAGRSDPRLQQHAQLVSRLVEEAARALDDEHRRAEYARHLTD